jgi:hypothetical protein
MNYYPQKSPVIERDPNIQKMRTDVFNAMESIISQTFPQEQAHVSSSEIKFVSFEQALKELATMKQNQFV